MPSDSEASSDDLDNAALFQEPDGYYQPEKPATFTTYSLISGEVIKLRLVGQNALWGHILWNAGQVTSSYLQRHAEELVKDKDVLELGAGAGLPGIVCAVLGARKVVITDYPDEDLISNLQYNIDHICLGRNSTTSVTVEGYLWGTTPLSPALSSKFDLLILADLVFNHSEHIKLLHTIKMCLRREREAKALVFFTPHRPWLLEKDLAFFDLAREGGFIVEKVLEQDMEKVMFDQDPGDEKLRRMVFGYVVRWEIVGCKA